MLWSKRVIMRIVFLIASLRGGGAERVASVLCNYWAAHQHDVILVTFDSTQNDFYTCNPNIKRYSTNSFTTSRNVFEKVKANLQRVAKIRNIIRKEKPDVVISFMDVANVLAIVSAAFTGVPVLVSERTYPPYYNHKNAFDYIRKFVYKFADGFVAQTNNVAQWALEFLPAKKIKVIANPIYAANIPADEALARKNVILAVGRLSHEKGFDMLINAFAKLQRQFPEWQLRIVGEGVDRPQLEQQIKTMGLQGRVELPGQTNLLTKEYDTAQIFVLSSRVEGFPNVLLEAMAHGLAAISFDCNSGPADLISNGINGCLIPANHVEALGTTLQQLLLEPELRARLAQEATKVRDIYTVDKIATAWLQLCAQVH